MVWHMRVNEWGKFVSFIIHVLSNCVDDMNGINYGADDISSVTDV